MSDEVNDLKACPFCGTTDCAVEEFDGDDGPYWVADCGECDAMVRGLTREEAIAGWNRRP